MKIKRVRLEVREAVLANSYTINIEESASKIDFNSLSKEEQIAEIRKSGERKAVNFFKQVKRVEPDVLTEFIKKNNNIIFKLKSPKVEHVNLVLEKHPKALNLIPVNKRTDEMIIKAIRPQRKFLTGPRDIKAQETIKNISSISSNTPFSSRVNHEIIKLVSGAPAKTIKKLESVFKKQNRKMPDELLKMIRQLEVKKNAKLNISLSASELAEQWASDLSLKN